MKCYASSLSLSLLAALLLGGCGSVGEARSESIHLDNRSGTELTTFKNDQTEIAAAPGALILVGESESIQPDDAADKAKASVVLTAGPEVVSAEIEADVPPQREASESALPGVSLSLFAGIALSVAGMAIFFGKRTGKLWAAPFAKGTGKGLMAIGAVVAVLPWFLQQWGWIIGLGAAVVVGALVAKTVYNMWRRHAALKRINMDIKTKGHDDG